MATQYLTSQYFLKNSLNLIKVGIYVILLLFCLFHIIYVLARESELRYLRKTLTDQEQAVSVLEKHVENLNIGIIKLTDNTAILKYGCKFYESRLNDLRSKFLDTFANIALPGK